MPTSSVNTHPLCICSIRGLDTPCTLAYRMNFRCSQGHASFYRPATYDTTTMANPSLSLVECNSHALTTLRSSESCRSSQSASIVQRGCDWPTSSAGATKSRPCVIGGIWLSSRPTPDVCGSCAYKRTVAPPELPRHPWIPAIAGLLLRIHT